MKDNNKLNNISVKNKNPEYIQTALSAVSELVICEQCEEYR